MISGAFGQGVFFFFFVDIVYAHGKNLRIYNGTKWKKKLKPVSLEYSPRVCKESDTTG